MIKKLSYLVLCSLATFLGNAQTFQWNTVLGSTGEDVVRGMTVDNSGYTYITGYFTDIVSVDTPSGNYQLNSNGSYDIFIAKIAPDGNFLWAYGMGGTSDDYGTSVATDLHGHVYITGAYNENFDADPGIGVTTLTSNGGIDIFVIELDSNGNFIDAKSIGGDGYEESTSIGVDGSDNVYVSGYFYSTTEFNPGGTSVQLSSFGTADGFIVKYSDEGTFQWAKQYGGDDFDLPMNMKVLNSGDLYFTGEFRETADFDPDPLSVHILSTPSNYKGAFVLHLDGSGNFMEAVKIGESSDTGIIGLDLEVDSAGEVYVTGYFRGLLTMNTSGDAISFNAGNTNNGYVAKVNLSTGVLWANHLESSEAASAYGLALSSDGILYVSGYYDDNLTIGSLSLTASETGNAYENFLVKLDSSGNFLDAYQYGGVSFVDGHYLEVDANNNVLIAGAFENTVDLDPTAGVTDSHTSSGFRDTYVIKMSAGTLGISSPQHMSLKVYPNPSNGSINLRSAESLYGKNYSVTDIMGKVVLQGVLGIEQQLSLISLSNGMYILNIENFNNIRVIKL